MVLPITWGEGGLSFHCGWSKTDGPPAVSAAINHLRLDHIFIFRTGCNNTPTLMYASQVLMQMLDKILDETFLPYNHAEWDVPW